MKFYIKDKPKIDFYLLGTTSNASFNRGHAYDFISEYITEFPGLYNEIIIVDEKNKHFKLIDFFNIVKKLEIDV
tara:strand:- start:26593 stop:26814 length:222 start_codon:yes stop_codon:yes gene_type:complete